MDKLTLRNIAREWASGILFGTGTDSFDPELGLTPEEEEYIVEEVHKIGRGILKKTGIEVPAGTLDEIVGRYYEFE